MFERDKDGTLWSVPMIHFDRSRNSVNLSRHDLELICEIADEYPALREALDQVKLIYKLINHPEKQPDSNCYRHIITRQPKE